MVKDEAPRLDPVPTLADIRAIAAITENIQTFLPTPAKKAKTRGITRRQIELCCQRGTLEEGPFRNERGDWQATLFRHAAGEEMRCVVIIKEGALIVRSNHYVG
jgi:hypothetical protein